MINTKQELIEYLKKTESSALDELIKLEIRESVIRELFKDREEDDHYWSEKLKKKEEEIKLLKKEISHWKSQYAAKIKRDENKRNIKEHKK